MHRWEDFSLDQNWNERNQLNGTTVKIKVIPILTQITELKFIKHRTRNLITRENAPIRM